MKKTGILSTIVFFSITMILGCEIKNKQQHSASSELIDPIVYNSSCDSIVQCEFVNYIDERNDTIINGIKYAYYLKLSDKYILAFREYNQEYKMLKGICVITEDTPFELIKDNENDLYYDSLLPSPDNRFIHICVYYETRNINKEEENITKFASGYILDIEKVEFVQSLNAMEVGGNWTYCNQYILNGEVLFDPIQNNTVNIIEN